MGADSNARSCKRCGARLTSSNVEQLCWPCQRMAHADRLNPPEVPREFWADGQLRDALIRERHIGHAVRSYRRHPFHGRRPIPQEVVARWFNISQAQLARIERGRPVTDLERLTQWAMKLRIPPEMLWFTLPEERSDRIPEAKLVKPEIEAAQNVVSVLSGNEVISDRGIEEVGEDLERRRLLQCLTALGVSASPPSRALGAVRSALEDTVGYDDRGHLDFWEETIIEYGYSYLVTSPISLIPDLAADLVNVRSIMRRIPQDTSEYRGWCRVGGALSALLAKSLSSLGQARDSREWWSMAQHLADASGDPNLGLWVRGEHVIHGLYENRPVPILLRQINSATELANDRPSVGLVDVSGARAQVSVLAGDYRSAEESLHQTEDILSQIPPSAEIGATGLVMGWREAELRYTEAWVYSHMGKVAETDRAAGSALSLYPASDWRSPAQVKLMQAFTRVRAGDITEGIRNAQAIYEPLASGRTTMVDTLARQVLNFVPIEAWKRTDVVEYQELLASRSQQGRAIEA